MADGADIANNPIHGLCWHRSDSELVFHIAFDIERRANPSDRMRGLSLETMQRIAEYSAQRWNAHIGVTGAQRIRIAKALSNKAMQGAPAAVQDGSNLILVRLRAWCPNGPRDREDCYDLKRQSITQIFQGVSVEDPSAPATIVEADVEIGSRGQKRPYFTV
jgi:hypothetical protein